MSAISLDRRFVEWSESAQTEAETSRLLGAPNGALGWPDILRARRAVILAEGGSGKSTELSEQNHALEAAGAYSFYLPLKRVGQVGVEGALTKGKARKLEEWRASNEKAWFFLDSVDEAKLEGVTLLEALQHVADAIEGAEFRAHVIISGRPTDWEFRKDLETFTAQLPPSPEPRREPLEPDDHVVAVIRRQVKAKPPSMEKPLLVLMSPLDKKQVETFARAKQINDVKQFLHGLSQENLWDFARRPLDLDWLAHYWRKHGAFDRFEKMLQANLVERLSEANPFRAKVVKVDQSLAMRALERIGAALVLGRLRDIEVPDSGALDVPRQALRLRDVLPDMPPSLQSDLIATAVFIPSAPGLARLHNDNDGVVSSYLAAKWMKRMLDRNCPWRAAKSMLFARKYGISTVKPSMARTAAWLSLWDDRTAEELARRQPMALVEHGDPSSLPLARRQAVLCSVLAAFARGENSPLNEHDGLRRFAAKDMDAVVQALWPAHAHLEAARHLLLAMVEHGALTGCARIAFEAGTAETTDDVTRALAAQAIAKIGDVPLRANYVKFLLEQCSTLNPDFMWNAVDALFPDALSAKDLAAILPKLIPAHGGEESDLGLGFYGPRLAARARTSEDALELLGLLCLSLPSETDLESAHQVDRSKPLLSTIQAFALRVFDLTQPALPPSVVIDVSLRLNAHGWRHGWSSDEGRELAERLRATPQLRRAALWRFADTYSALANFPGQPLAELWQLQSARFEHGLGLEDAAWLLRDLASREDENEKVLATRLAMAIWSGHNKPEKLLREIAATVAGDPALKAAVEAWSAPEPMSLQMSRMWEEDAKLTAANEARKKRVDESWAAFAREIRDDPMRLEHLSPPSSEGVDARLYHIWQLLGIVSDNSSSSSTSDVALLAPIFGADAVEKIREAFAYYWRLGSPVLRCERDVELVNVDSAMDRIGIVGVSILASNAPNWADRLPPEEVERAAIYATLEHNGYPRWFEQLCMCWPDLVRPVLRRALAPELASNHPGGRRETLERLARSATSIVELAAADLFDFVAQTTSDNAALLAPALQIARHDLPRRKEFLELVLARSRTSSSTAARATWLACAFGVEANSATAELLSIESGMDKPERTALAEYLLPRISGRTWPVGGEEMPYMSTESARDLVRFAFDAVNVDQDINRPMGKVYSPGPRDQAESARDHSLRHLAARPGAATFKALDDLARHPGFPIPRLRMDRLAHARAAQDSESAPWTPADVHAFEDDFLAVPRTPEDLQRVAADCIEDLQHRLTHGDYGQGTVVARLKDEVDVQRWMADALQAKQGRSFTVEREPHLADEKEPDIRLSAKGSDARLPIEIKVAESWSLRELEEALTVQLMGRYLRDENTRWGILLLVHRRPRAKGWEDTATGEFLSFAQVAVRLQVMASAVSASDSAGPQMQVCLIDVSSVKI